MTTGRTTTRPVEPEPAGFRSARPGAGRPRRARTRRATATGRGCSPATIAAGRRRHPGARLRRRPRAILNSRGGRLVEARARRRTGAGLRGDRRPLLRWRWSSTRDAERPRRRLTVLSLSRAPTAAGRCVFVPIDTLTGRVDDRVRLRPVSAARSTWPGSTACGQATANCSTPASPRPSRSTAPELAALIAPVAPLRFDNPDDLRGRGRRRRGVRCSTAGRSS